MVKAKSGKSAIITAICLVSLALSACASTSDPYAPDTPTARIDTLGTNVYDPFEPFNRVLFEINDTLDKTVLKPVAYVYRNLPTPARDGVRNFFNNLREPITITNDLLQGQLKFAGISLTRFVVNSTVGLAGVIDVANNLGLAPHYEDFGQTLGFYGVGEGPYLFIPFLGPSNLRDSTGLISSGLINQSIYAAADINDGVLYTSYVLNGIDLRERSLEFGDNIEQSSIDYYASLRNLYTQKRRSDIDNGKININDLPDLDDYDDYDYDDDDYYNDAGGDGDGDAPDDAPAEKDYK